MFVWLGSFAVLPFLMFFPAWSLLLWTLGFPQGSLRSVFVIFGLLFLHVGFFDLGHLLGVSQACLHLSFELVVREGERRALEGAVVDGNITGVLHFEKSRRQHHVKFNVVLVHVCNSMTSLFAHKVAQPTKWRFLPKNSSQLVIFVIELAFTLV